MTESTTLSRWQDPKNDGYPTDEYFDAVIKALETAGITIYDAWRDEPYDYTIKLGDSEAAALDYASVYVSWRVGEESEPLTGDWQTIGGIRGWYWVPYSRDDKAGGDFAKSFDLPILAEPEQVAAAVAELVKDGDQ